MRKDIKIIIAAVILVILIVILGFGKKIEKGVGALQVGVIFPLTGSSAPEGTDLLNGFLLAKEKINPNVVLYVEDSQSNAKDGITAAKKILDTENVDVLVSFGSSISIPLLAVADQYNKPLIATAVAQDSFTQRSKNAFRLFAPARQYASRAAELANSLGFQRVSTLTIHDEYGESSKDQFKKSFGGSISHQESFEIPEQDFRTILAKISDSDAIFSVGYNIHWVNLFKQRKELNKNIVFISNQNMVSSFVRSQVGDLLTNAFAIVPPSTLLDEETKEFFEEYTKKYGRQPDWVAPFGYDMMLVLDAIQKTGKKPIDAIRAINVKGLNGVIHFDQNGEINIPLVVVKAENGEIKVLNLKGF